MRGNTMTPAEYRREMGLPPKATDYDGRSPLDVACPTCDAKPHTGCTTTGVGPRHGRSPHESRREAWHRHLGIARQPKPMVERRRLEDELQRQIVDWLEALGPRLDAVWFAVPNGGARKPIEAAILQGLGVRAGAPDLVFLWGGSGREVWLMADGDSLKTYRNREPGAGCLELKAGKGRQSPGQREFQAECERRGVSYAVARSLDEAADILHGWGIAPPLNHAPNRPGRADGEIEGEDR